MYFETKNTNWVGDIAYWDGTKVKTVPSDKYYSSMGSPIGVVVIPEGFAPDGKTRIVSLYGVDTTGNQINSNFTLTWGLNNIDTSVINYNMMPTTDNNGSTSTGTHTYAHFPSDIFTGPISYVDPKVKYYSLGYTPFIPSPYLGDGPNPEYHKNIPGYNNTLSDFKGLQITQTLVGLGSDYQAANACWNYKDGSSNLQWYLPGVGELGYLITRLNLINNVIISIGGFILAPGFFWSSSEYCYNLTFGIDFSNGVIGAYDKYHNFYSRPFAIID